jgi:hypothetical protein
VLDETTTAGLEEAAAAAAGALEDDAAATAAEELATVTRVVAEALPLVLEAAVEETLVLQYCSRAFSTPSLLR